jgi:hypothetical protein
LIFCVTLLTAAAGAGDLKVKIGFAITWADRLKPKPVIEILKSSFAITWTLLPKPEPVPLILKKNFLFVLQLRCLFWVGAAAGRRHS